MKSGQDAAPTVSDDQKTKQKPVDLSKPPKGIQSVPSIRRIRR